MGSVSGEMQKAWRAALVGDAGVAALIGDRVYDGAPVDPAVPYVTIGAADATFEDPDCLALRRETMQLDVWDRDQGRRRRCAAVVDAMVRALRGHGADLGDGVGVLVDTEIELTRVFMDPDGITAHGVVQVTALVEEAVA